MAEDIPGAAPGVGKTYEMLESGRAKQAEGVDVVTGLVETHGRRETAALLDGFETIPRAKVLHKGHPLEETDLDAILARKPGLVLVDELALRQTAQRVDDHLVSHMQANAISGPWPAGDRVLVCIGPALHGA